MKKVRLIITDQQWEILAKILKKVKRPDGCPPQLSNRMFIEAVLYVARTGVPWRDMPDCFGKWDAVYNRFRRWEKSGVWQGLWEELQSKKFKSAAKLFVDSTIVKAHQHAAGSLKKTADKNHRLWDILGAD